MEISLGTFNILNTACRYSERQPLILSTLQHMDCDFVGVQEINFGVNLPPIEASGWQVLKGSLPEAMLKENDETFRIDGNGLLYRTSEPKSPDLLTFSDGLRIAQKAYFEHKGIRFLMVNTHLDHTWDSLRRRETKELLDWLEPHFTNGDNVILTGDFNDTPASSTYKLLATKFKSTYCEVHGTEPVITFPTGLQGPHCDNDCIGIYDYIWYSGNVLPISAEVLCDNSGPDIYASDHYAIKAKFLIS